MAKASLRFTGLRAERGLVRISGNGTRMICADGSGNLRAWDIASPLSPEEQVSERAGPGRLLLSAQVPKSELGIVAVGIDRSGRRAVSLGRDGSVHGWDLNGGTQLFADKRKSGRREAVRFDLVGITADGSRTILASSGLGAKGGVVAGLHVRDVTSGERLLAIDGVSAPIAVDADGTQAVAVDRTSFKVWDLRTGREVIDLGDVGNRRILALSPDLRMLVASSGPSIRVFDLTTRQETAVLSAHTTDVEAVGFSFDGQRLLTRSSPPRTGYYDPSGGGFTGSPVYRSGFPLLVEWDLATGSKIQAPRKFVLIDGEVTADLSRAASVDRLNEVVVWTPVPKTGHELHIAVRRDLSRALNLGTAPGNFAWETVADRPRA